VLEAAKSAERDVPDYLCRCRFLQARRRALSGVDGTQSGVVEFYSR